MPLLDDFMKNLSHEMEMDEIIEPEMSGVYVLPLEDDLSLIISMGDLGISLTADIADCPEIRREQFLSELLLGNLFGQGTMDAVLGLSSNGKKITLARHLDHAIEYDEFSDVLEDFMNSAIFWREEAQNFK
ncbi:MAG: type III secretion system chaperone [Chlamydiota bacterium]|nr:type III secretion system chaperone [Chlamydiota bacterium]